MFMMKRSTKLILMVVFGVLSTGFQSTQGIRCYACGKCNRTETGIEVDCSNLRSGDDLDTAISIPIVSGVPGTSARPIRPPGPPPGGVYDRCLTAEKNTGTFQRSCANAEIEDKFTRAGVKCDEFGKSDTKICFCTTDLCNFDGGEGGKNAVLSLYGYSKLQLLFTSIASISAYIVTRLLF
ncbi:hypothetical protein Ocin01_13467 [Orchesella cincta]|uniref:Protein sleepless n=1 Tax=Orchesella cincta TaxID=48709 RepID=A0A1D2MJY7_ORCCI|nr:hypothetical protein Ocin01_13467 [Orchesella cincta]